jgi:hypothetical protein
MIHSEEMVKLKGPIRLVSPGNNPQLKQIENKSGFHLSDVVVLHRNVQDNGEVRLEGCWVGPLRDGAGVLLRRDPVILQKGALPFAKEREQAAELDSRKRLNVDPLLTLAFRFAPKTDPLYGQRDEWRLVGRIDEVLPGSQASPEASQTTGSTVVLAHLAYEPAPFPEGDVNSPSDVLQDGRRNAYDEDYDQFLGEPPLE